METNSACRAVVGPAAHRLHIVRAMKFTVGILAEALLAGCGVGLDDPEGQAAAGAYFASGTQALTVNSTPVENGTTAPDAGTTATTTGSGAPANAPQDPIPAIDGFHSLNTDLNAPLPGFTVFGPRPGGR